MWILIATEDEGVSRGVSRVLEAERHRTHWARSWPEAEGFLSSGRYQTILLDPELPGLTPGALRSVMSDDARRPRVILYSQASPVELATSSALLEADGCLSELVGPHRLLSVLAEVWRCPTRRPPSYPPRPGSREMSEGVPPRRRLPLGVTRQPPASLSWEPGNE
jgi:DNA-binding NtrC family response regulator